VLASDAAAPGTSRHALDALLAAGRWATTPHLSPVGRRGLAGQHGPAAPGSPRHPQPGCADSRRRACQLLRMKPTLGIALLLSQYWAESPKGGHRTLRLDCGAPVLGGQGPRARRVRRPRRACAGLLGCLNSATPCSPAGPAALASGRGRGFHAGPGTPAGRRIEPVSPGIKRESGLPLLPGTLHASAVALAITAADAMWRDRIDRSALEAASM